MRNKLTKVVAGVAALAVASVGLILTSAIAAPPLGANSLSPLLGTSGTTFTLLPPVGSSCTGSGSGVPAYRWQTYMVAAAVDASTLSYASGPNAVGANFVSPLYDTLGNPIINKNPSASPLGLISGIPTMNFGALAGVVPVGQYKIGFACTQAGAIENGKYWETPITVTNLATTAWVYGWSPAAPVITPASLTPGNGSLDGIFSSATATPPASSYTVTATPANFPTNPVVTLSPGAPGAFSLTGLANGVQYSVTVSATNSVGASPLSNAVLGTPNPAPRPAVTNLAAVPGTGSVALSWTPPTGVAPTGYSIAVSQAGTPVVGSPFSASAAAVGTNVSGLTAGLSYDFVVTPTHTSPFTSLPASISAVPNAAQVIVQDILVNRPAGALVLTQRCGVYGALDAEAITSNGFPAVLAAGAAGGSIGTAPATPTAGGSPDPLFNQYPYPVDGVGASVATYPTHCGVNLGFGQLITSGPLAGEYFAASGRINQVTVVDTRDIDAGWSANATMSAFTGSVSGGFSGNYLGWTPKMTLDSGLTSAGYNQAVSAGAVIAPDTASGLASGKTLASAPGAAGLGIATLDARLKLLIPVTADSGNYTGTLTFTVI